MSKYKFKIGDLVQVDKSSKRVHLRRYDDSVLKITDRKRSMNSYGSGERYLYKFDHHSDWYYERRFKFYKNPFELAWELFEI